MNVADSPKILGGSDITEDRKWMYKTLDRLEAYAGINNNAEQDDPYEVEGKIARRYYWIFPNASLVLYSFAFSHAGLGIFLIWKKKWKFSQIVFLEISAFTSSCCASKMK